MADFAYQDGQIVMDAATQEELMRLVNIAAQTRDQTNMRQMGALMTEPISTIADYAEWANRLFMNKQINPGEDWTIPIEEYQSLAFMSSPDGRARRTRQSGLLNVRPAFDSIRAGFELGWDDQANATWNILGNKVKRAGEEMARKRDQMAYTVLQAAANSVGHVVNTTGGVLTRASVDNILKQAAAIGFPISRVIGNPATFQDMRTASFFTWDSNKVPLAYGDASLAKDIMSKGYLTTYGGAEWFETLGLSSGTTFGAISGSTTPIATGAAVLFYVADAAHLGFNVQRGSSRYVSDMDPENLTTRHWYDETRFYYVANGYAVWQQIITLS